MVWWLLDYSHKVAPLLNTAVTKAERAGAGIGTALGVGMIVFFWLAGSVIFGLFVMFTRGPKMLVPSDEKRPT
jgi:hypothetical protein